MRTVGMRTAAAVACAFGATVGFFPSAVSAMPGRTTVCQQVATNVGVRNRATTQVIVVLPLADAPTNATLQVASRTSKGWMCGQAMSARVGREGVRPLIDRRSGDGTTPAGVFSLGIMTAWDGEVFSFFGTAADPGVTAGGYRLVKSGDCFGATPNHRDYGHLVQRTYANCPGPKDEYLPSIDVAYTHAALIGANMEPNVSGDEPGEIPYASAIFLHRFSLDDNGNPKPTSGCVSLELNNLVDVLRVMLPTTMFAIGESKWLLANS